MNLDNLTNEIKERVQEGTKPSDLKKKRGRPSKQNISENEETGVKQEITSRLTQLRDNENEIRQMFEE
jgi:hypothetical protein